MKKPIDIRIANIPQGQPVAYMIDFNDGTHVISSEKFDEKSIELYPKQEPKLYSLEDAEYDLNDLAETKSQVKLIKDVIAKLRKEYI